MAKEPNFYCYAMESPHVKVTKQISSCQMWVPVPPRPPEHQHISPVVEQLAAGGLYEQDPAQEPNFTGARIATSSRSSSLTAKAVRRKVAPVPRAVLVVRLSASAG